MTIRNRLSTVIDQKLAPEKILTESRPALTQPQVLDYKALKLRSPSRHRKCISSTMNAISVEDMNRFRLTGAVLQVGRGNFDSQVLRSQQPVLVVFWAPWSAACRMTEPVLNEVIKQLSEGVTFVTINADENPHLSLWYGIRSLPTLLYFIKGEVRCRIVGTASKEAVLADLGYLKGNPCNSPFSPALNNTPHNTPETKEN